MIIRKRTEKDVIILYPEGNINLDSSDLIETVSYLIRTGSSKILINLKSIDLVDYNGLIVLAIIYKNVVNHEGEIKFCMIPAHLRELLKVSLLEETWEIYEDEDKAVSSFIFETKTDKLKLRRQFKRLDLHTKIKFATEFGRESKRFVSAKIFNISGVGVFISTHRILKIGTRILLKMPFLTDVETEVKGDVVWHADQVLQPQLYPGMGIKFVETSTEIQGKILEFIDRNLIYRREKS